MNIIEAIINQRDTCDLCGDDSVLSAIGRGDGDTRQQLARAGILSGDLVAIVKLDELTAILAELAEYRALVVETTIQEITKCVAGGRR